MCVCVCVSLCFVLTSTAHTDPSTCILAGDPTFAPATVAPVMISPTTKGLSEGKDWVFGSG